MRATVLGVLGSSKWDVLPRPLRSLSGREAARAPVPALLLVSLPKMSSRASCGDLELRCRRRPGDMAAPP
eukprot:6187152-Pleurochrysis_carterae.AAC.1